MLAEKLGKAEEARAVAAGIGAKIANMEGKYRQHDDELTIVTPGGGSGMKYPSLSSTRARVAPGPLASYTALVSDRK